MDLHSSAVHRKLENKLKIAGLEASDLILLLLFAAVMNLFFGRTPFGPYVVFVIPSVIGVILYFGKRGKPDKYLFHLFRYYYMPQAFCAGDLSRDDESQKRKVVE